ncbi:MAG: VanZ family protein [Actinobacteria bacterium]|nr:VanZ family protein [Actinomycetota bacterium]
MRSAVEYALALLRIPAVQLTLLLTIVAGAVLAKPVARLLRWSWLGSMLAMWGLGAAIAVTLVGRLGRADAIWDPALIRVCISGPTSSLLAPEGLLNLVLLLPLGIGLYLASHNGVLSSAIVVVTALTIESLQAITGLGLCQPSDALRNALGGLIGVWIGWLLIRSLGDRVPAYLRVGSSR